MTESRYSLVPTSHHVYLKDGIWREVDDLLEYYDGADAGAEEPTLCERYEAASGYYVDAEGHTWDDVSNELVGVYSDEMAAEYLSNCEED